MPKAPCLVLDTKDDRREMVYLLGKLPPHRRLSWLDWCCRQSVVPNSAIRPDIRRDMRERAKHAQRDSSIDEKLTIECFLDVWSLALQYSLSLDTALAKLVAMVRCP